MSPQGGLGSLLEPFRVHVDDRSPQSIFFGAPGVELFFGVKQLPKSIPKIAFVSTSFFYTCCPRFLKFWDDFGDFF